MLEGKQGTEHEAVEALKLGLEAGNDSHRYGRDVQ